MRAVAPCSKWHSSPYAWDAFQGHRATSASTMAAAPHQVCLFLVFGPAVAPLALGAALTDVLVDFLDLLAGGLRGQGTTRQTTLRTVGTTTSSLAALPPTTS